MKAYILGILILILFITISCNKECESTYEGTWKGTNNAIYNGYFQDTTNSLIVITNNNGLFVKLCDSEHSNELDIVKNIPISSDMTFTSRIVTTNTCNNNITVNRTHSLSLSNDTLYEYGNYVIYNSFSELIGRGTFHCKYIKISQYSMQ